MASESLGTEARAGERGAQRVERVLAPRAHVRPQHAPSVLGRAGACVALESDRTVRADDAQPATTIY